MTVNGNDVSVEMVKNGQNMMNAYSSDCRSVWDTATISAALALVKGDKVWIRRFYSGRHIHGNYNMFSGYLISGNI